VDTEWDAVGVLSNAGSNLSFTTTLSKRKTIDFNRESRGFVVFWRLKKRDMG
jgi:hypothetical protein